MRAVCLAGVVVSVIWLVAVPRVSGVSPDAGAAGAGSGTRSTAVDSLDLLEEALGEGLSQDAAEDIASEIVSQFDPGTHSRGRSVGWLDGLFFGTEAVAGQRSMARATGGWRRRGRLCRFDVRRDRDRYGGFFELSGVGPLAQLVVGGIRPRFGEGMLLGARRSPFTPPRPDAPGAAGAAAPTSSIWGRKLGVAVSVRSGSAGWSAVGCREIDGGEVYWTWFSHCAAAAAVGLALGTRRPRGSRRVLGVDGTLTMARAFSSVSAAAEVSRFRGRSFAAVRLGVRAEGRWSLELYASPVPRSSSGGVIGPGDERSEQRGGALHRMGRVGRVDTRLSMYVNFLSTSESFRRRRRIDASVRSRTGDYGWWNTSVRFYEDAECAYSREPIDYQPSWDRRRRLQFRAGWTGTGRGPLRQRYGLTIRHDGDGSTSVVGTMGLTLSFRGLEAGFQVSNYSMGSGQTGYIVRPGAIGVESISSVTQTGSDVTARVRGHWRGAWIAFHWAQPWHKHPRSYLTLRLSL